MSTAAPISPGSVWGWVLLGLFLPSWVFILVVMGEFDENTWIFVSVMLTGVVGTFLVAKLPRHPVSWLLTGTALAGTLSAFSSAMEPTAETTELTGLELAAMYLGAPAWFAFIFLTVAAIPLLFPTGASPSPRWRWVMWLGIPLYLLFAMLWVIQERFCSGELDLCFSNPIGMAGVTNPEQGPVLYLLFGCALGAVASMVVRFRRSQDVERQQLKALLYTVSVFASAIVLVDIVGTELLGLKEPAWFGPVWGLLWVAIPVSIALAITRYRLYEIDRIVSRTVTYALVAAVSAAVFAGGVVLFHRVLPFQNDLAVAASTLAVAGLFNPLRRRVRGLVERRFNRSRYDAERVVGDLAGRLRESAAVDELATELQRVLNQTLQPRTVSVWIKGRSGTL